MQAGREWVDLKKESGCCGDNLLGIFGASPRVWLVGKSGNILNQVRRWQYLLPSLHFEAQFGKRLLKTVMQGWTS